MMMKRTFTKEEKLQIIKEATEQGVKATLEKHGIYPASYYSWKQKLEQMGEEGLVKAQIKQKQRKIKFRLLKPHHQLSGKMSLRSFLADTKFFIFLYF